MHALPANEASGLLLRRRLWERRVLLRGLAMRANASHHRTKHQYQRDREGHGAGAIAEGWLRGEVNGV